MRFLKFLPALALLGALCAPSMHAQQQTSSQQSQAPADTGSSAQPQPANVLAPVQPAAPEAGGNTSHAMPVPAARSGLAAYASLNEQTTQTVPDTHALSGGEQFGLGSLLGFRRLFDPAIEFSASGDTGFSGTQTYGVTTFGGSLTMNQSWSRYRLTLAYRGGRSISYPGSSYSDMYHDLAFSQAILAGRWTLRVRDDMGFSPQATFGGLDTGGPNYYAMTSFLSSIQPSLATGQSILTGRARRLSNTALGEIDYELSRRTSITFTGSYGLLHFLDPGYIDSHDVNGRVGYDYMLNPKDSISFIYGYGRTTFSGNPGNIGAHMVQIAFGRKITGRLAFQVAAGPQLLQYNHFATSIPNQLSWNVSSGLTYATRRAGYSLSYSHGLTGGSGAVFGAETEAITGSVSHSFTRFWSGVIEGGYALNSVLSITNTGGGHFNYWFGGANLGRQVGRHLRVSLSYALQQQNVNGATCQVASCGSAGVRQIFGVTMEWHPVVMGLGE